MNHIEITVEQHEACVDAAAERDTLRAKLADDAPFVALGRWAANMVVALSDARPADESRAAAINAFIDAHARQKARIEELEREVAKATAAPIRIVLDQGPPTEAGWYMCGERPEWAELVYMDAGDVRGDETATDYSWSRRLDIVVPESEVGG